MMCNNVLSRLVMTRAGISTSVLSRSLSLLLHSRITTVEIWGHPLVPLPALAGNSHLLNSWSECHSNFCLCLTPHYSALRNMPLPHGICMTYTQSTKNIYALIFPQESGSVATTPYISDFYSEVPLLILSTTLLISYHGCDSKLNPFSSSKFQGTH